MNKFKLIIVVMLVTLTSCSAHTDELQMAHDTTTRSFRVASYNIRYNPPSDEESGNGWDVRKGPLSELILRHRFDLVATQEGDEGQLANLMELLPGFDYVGFPYGGNDMHLCATLYKKDLFSVIDKGVFWFSETPEVPSIGWDATDRRICTWTKFNVKGTEKEFYVFNVHFYWRLEIAKKESGPLLAKKIKEISNGTPVIVMGDFNSTENTSQIKAIKETVMDAFDVTQSPREGVIGTNLGGGVFQGNVKNRIDYIFVSSEFTVEDYKVISDTYGTGKYPSDHLPVTSMVSF
ncbi:endonuclease [Echinicola strongylocentroti]|uniref:Endonuclease n=1 Tax=Echinicola strongylocentroti TaxID=1795355 RepID=A0A2Z4IEZ8_9BACT|nr:endonuclease/exonuclease/phosphatase family protein [Echinicola strongylocentroti]AWW29662.1 endonuclease [Echinicola strongylocentroti]